MEIKNQYLHSFDWTIQSKVEEAPSKASDETVPPVDIEPDDRIFMFSKLIVVANGEKKIINSGSVLCVRVVGKLIRVALQESCLEIHTMRNCH